MCWSGLLSLVASIRLTRALGWGLILCLSALRLLLRAGPKSQGKRMGWEGTLFLVPAPSPSQPGRARDFTPPQASSSKNEESWIPSEATSQFSQETCFFWPSLSSALS